MEAQIITIFYIIDDILKSIKFSDNIQAKISTSEIMTIAITASLMFDSNQEKARLFLKNNNM